MPDAPDPPDDPVPTAPADDDDGAVVLYAEDVVADLEDAASIEELASMIHRYTRDLAVGRLAGRPRSAAEAAEVRAALVEHLRADALPALPQPEALRLLDLLARRDVRDLEALRPALARPRPAPPAPSPPTLMERARGFDALVAAGRLAEARALCAEMIEYLQHDEASCMRAGDFGAATEAERERATWLGHARGLG